MQNIGLVFSGGGGKGAYQIGAWGAFRKFGLDKKITAVSGTSIGALNAALFLQKEFALAQKAWSSISHEKVLTSKYDKFVDSLDNLTRDKTLIDIFTGIAQDGVFTRDGLRKIIKENLDLSTISSSDIDCYICCCQLPLFTAKYFLINGLEQEKIERILLASSAIPFFFKIEAIDKKLYLDGGIRDNVPVRPLYDAGYRRFIIVHLKADPKINKGDFPDAKFIDIYPDAADPDFSFKDTFDFSSEGAKKRMQLGYMDTVRELERRIKLHPSHVSHNKGRKSSFK